MPASKPAFRMSLRTSDQTVAIRRAARIASWMMNVKAAEDPKGALLALWPRLQALEARPEAADCRAVFTQTSSRKRGNPRRQAARPKPIIRRCP